MDSRSQYFCRYCEVTRSEFDSDPNICGPQNTPESYNSAIVDLQTEDHQDVKGVKVNSKGLMPSQNHALSVQRHPNLLVKPFKTGLLLILIGDTVQDLEDDVWQLLLQLKDIVGEMCARFLGLRLLISTL